MDQARYQEAQGLYEAGEYRQAAKAFLAAAGKGAEANGAAYHMAGNALMRLRRYSDAVAVYHHALRDETYSRRGAVRVNLAQALCQLAEYPDALAEFEQALDEPDYTTPYKALQGMAGALLEMGHIQDAAVAYRKAALDPVNPNPGKALNNLGLCFMALGRPADATEAYKAALGFDAYEGRGRALGNLGQAFTALERWDDAVRAFQRANELHGHRLSPAAAADYERALANAAPEVRVAAGAPTDHVSAASAPVSEKVDGWETGEMRPAPLTQPTEEFEAQQVSQASTGWSAEELVDMEGVSLPKAPAEQAAESGHPRAERAAANLGIGDEAAVGAFYAMTDEQMRERDREARRAARAERRASRSPLVIVAVAVAAVLAVGVLLGGLWYVGVGWPTQAQTVTGLMNARKDGEAVDRFWVAVPDRDVAKEMAKIPPVESFSVDKIQSGSSTSLVVVTVTPRQGAPLHYQVTLAREGVGWKVTGVDNNWNSVGDQ